MIDRSAVSASKSLFFDNIYWKPPDKDIEIQGGEGIGMKISPV